jgi:serine/threonine-protein kinase HipA
LIKIFRKNRKIATFEQDNKNYLIKYTAKNLQDSIALSLPNNKSIYFYEYEFPPFFESFLPEGYLFEIFKSLLTKECGYMDDYLVFSFLANNIENRVKFVSDKKSLNFDFLSL